MLNSLEYILIGVGIGSFCGTCMGICYTILKNYIDSKNHKTDVENITKNILHILNEENDSKVEYMTARPIV